MLYSIKLNKTLIRWIVIASIILSAFTFTYFKGYNNGQQNIQTKFDAFVKANNDAIAKKNADVLLETKNLNEYWKGQIKKYEDEKQNLVDRIDAINITNGRLSNDIKEYRKREAARSNSTNTTNNEADVAWTLFENRRRIDSERIKDAESINSQLIEAKDYIDNICTK